MGDNSQNSKQVVTTIASYIARNINERFTFCEWNWNSMQKKSDSLWRVFKYLTTNVPHHIGTSQLIVNGLLTGR